MQARNVVALLSFISISLSQTSYQQSEEPYFLSTGEAYRDKETLENAKLAALFAKNRKKDFQDEGPTQSEDSDLNLNLNFYQLRNFTFGVPLPDYEIFGYIDSQFLNPPFENLENRLFLHRNIYDGKTVEIDLGKQLVLSKFSSVHLSISF